MTAPMSDELLPQEPAECPTCQSAEASYAALLDLVVEVGERAVPGFISRGEDAARLASAVAEQMEVPEEFCGDLIRAARLHPLGFVALSGEPDREADPWRWASAAAGELREIPCLAPVAEIIAGIAENWDGSGHPEGRQRGQIHLRSRILRVVIDLRDATEAAGSTLAAELERMRAHAGTWYDPGVLAAAEVALLAPIRLEVGVVRVAPERLVAGMMLEEDLVTAMGIKLLMRGAVLNETSLDIIRRRHQTDPIVHAVRVRLPQ